MGGSNGKGDRKGGQGRECGEGLKLRAICRVIWKPNKVQVSYNIYIYEGTLNAKAI